MSKKHEEVSDMGKRKAELIKGFEDGTDGKESTPGMLRNESNMDEVNIQEYEERLGNLKEELKRLKKIKKQQKKINKLEEERLDVIREIEKRKGKERKIKDHKKH